jgi:hypothetical protein
MDALDKEISDEEARLKKYRAQAEAFTAKADASALKIATLRRAASLRPVSAGEVLIVGASAHATVEPAGQHLLPEEVAAFVERATADSPSEIRRGRKPGAISADWRSVLASLYLMGGKQPYPDIHKVAAQNGINIDISSVRERVRIFVERGLMEGNPTDGFEVTWVAMQKFGFRRETAPDGAEVIEGPQTGSGEGGNPQSS